MKYYTIPPPERLVDFVQYFWVFEGTASQADPYIHRCIASTGVEWMFHYQGSFHELKDDNHKLGSFSIGLDGVSNQYRRFIVEKPFGIFGVHLYPYALQTLFGVPAKALVNESLNFYSVANKTLPALEEKMLTATHNWERVNIISSFLEKNMNKPVRPEIPYIVRAMHSAQGNVDILELAHKYFLSIRQFQRIFKEHTGFSPKSFAKIARFNAVMSQSSNAKETLTEKAYRFGYYDQAHFIQDFKTYTGYTPGTYFTGKAEELI